MQWRQIRRLVEARLYEYGARSHEEPGTPISSVYQAPTLPPKKGRHGPSQEERWVMSREDVIAVGRLIVGLPEQERKLVHLRYVQALPWRSVCRSMSISRTEALRIRDRAISLLAAAMGLVAQVGEADVAGTVAGT